MVYRGGGGILSVDSISQASSARTKGPAKVIYNKFFKDKGFLPPLMSATSNTARGKINSRCQSVSSQVSFEGQTNKSIGSLRSNARSPESHIIFRSGDNSAQRIG